MILIWIWNDFWGKFSQKSPFPLWKNGFVWKLWEKSIPVVDDQIIFFTRIAIWIHLGGILYTHCLKTLKILIENHPTWRASFWGGAEIANSCNLAFPEDGPGMARQKHGISERTYGTWTHVGMGSKSCDFLQIFRVLHVHLLLSLLNNFVFWKQIICRKSGDAHCFHRGGQLRSLRSGLESDIEFVSSATLADSEQGSWRLGLAIDWNHVADWPLFSECRTVFCIFCLKRRWIS